MKLWRVCRPAHVALDGEGARLHGGRWSPQGFRAVYASATLSLAVLEVLVRMRQTRPIDDWISLEIEIPRGIVVPEVDVDHLPAERGI